MDVTFYFVIIGILGIVLLVTLLRRQHASPLPVTTATVSKDLYDTILVQNEMLRTELSDKEAELRKADALLAAREQSLEHLKEVLNTQKSELLQVQERLKSEFENLASRLLEEKSLRFTEQNARQLQSVLTPLREKIRDFEENVERKFLEETREKSSLKKEIDQLRDLNQQLSRDAINLTNALKGQSKIQGDWGELQLEVLLEKSGLIKGMHFLTQNTFRDDEGSSKRPDFIIRLPENRQLIIDAKVSLTAFEQFYNAADPERQAQYLKAHIDSIRRHVQDLSSKNYQLLYEINTPDYLLLFVPLEQALNVASQADPKLFTDALDKNIVLVSTSSLLATMRTISYLWKQETQARSVQEIARQSGLLYDKFVGFVEDLKSIGTRLDGAQLAYSDAMNKLVNSPKYGDTLVGRAEKLRQLGAKSSKTLPRELTELALESDSDNTSAATAE